MGRLADVQAVVDARLLGQGGPENLRCGLIHLHGVSALCALLALRRGQDVEICAAAGLLHDVATYETGEDTGHAQRSAVRAGEILGGIPAFSPVDVASICDAIAVHSAKAATHGPLAELLKDADVLQYHLANPDAPDSAERTRRLRSVLQAIGRPPAQPESSGTGAAHEGGSIHE